MAAFIPVSTALRLGDTPDLAFSLYVCPIELNGPTTVADNWDWTEVK